uniref:Uncharacterized protein n=1 Tax=Anopheles farauti TaxID=69004 RepID=A0A182Q6C3_9DIPT
MTVARCFSMAVNKSSSLKAFRVNSRIPPEKNGPSKNVNPVVQYSELKVNSTVGTLEKRNMKTSFGFVVRNIFAMSSSLKEGANGFIGAPIVSSAQANGARFSLFALANVTTSPCRTPFAVRFCANRTNLVRNSAYVMERPVSMSRCITRSGERNNISSITCPKLASGLNNNFTEGLCQVWKTSFGFVVRNIFAMSSSLKEGANGFIGAPIVSSAHANGARFSLFALANVTTSPCRTPIADLLRPNKKDNTTSTRTAKSCPMPHSHLSRPGSWTTFRHAILSTGAPGSLPPAELFKFQFGDQPARAWPTEEIAEE